MPYTTVRQLAVRIDLNQETAPDATTLLKFRHLRDLSGRANLTPAAFADLLDADPPDWEDARQMKMF